MARVVKGPYEIDNPPYSGPLWWESIKFACVWLWKKVTGQKVPKD